MAKQQRNDSSQPKSAGKAARRSERTKANKTRKHETRVGRLLKAAERRTKDTWTDPATGRKINRGTARLMAEARERQAGRINKKQEQRRNFRTLSASDKADHRMCGKDHTVPRSVLRERG